MTLLDLAEKNDLGVLINRPLNAFYNNKVISLAEPFVYGAPSTEEINLEIENIQNLEKSISAKLKSCGFNDISPEIEDNLYISGKLQNKWKDAKSISNWESALNQYFLPRFHYYKNFIKNNSLKNEELEMDLFSCTFKIGKLFSTISTYYKNKHLKLTDKIKKDLAEIMPVQAKKLSNTAIRILRSTKGVTSVLVGMINPPYVSDVTDELKVPVKKDFDLSKIKISVSD